MTAIPARFRAYVAEKIGDAVERGVREFRESDLPAGEVEIRVAWSSVNYKDGLATRADGKVARISPLIPGIDLAGEVVASSDRSIDVGAAVLAHGYELGVSRHGGYAEYQRVPAGWVVPLPPGLSPREAMSIGTAGFTAAMSVAALEERGLDPADGPVLVTGASGGVGGTALAILADRGYEVWAATGKPDEAARLLTMGAAGILSRDEVTGEGKPLESERWAGAVDAVGGATLPYVLRTLRTGACGRSLRQCRRREVRDDRLPVHPARRLAAWDGLGQHADRPPARAVGSHRHGPATARARRALHRGHARYARRGARRRSSPVQRVADGSCGSGPASSPSTTSVPAIPSWIVHTNR